MKSYLLLIPIFIFALFQGAFLPLNLVLLTVLFFSVFNPDKKALWVAFWGGLILDLAQGTTFGLSAAIFLFLSLLLLLYSRRFEPAHLVFLPIFVFLSSFFYSFLAWQQTSWVKGLILLILAGLALFVLKLFRFEKIQGLKLKV